MQIPIITGNVYFQIGMKLSNDLIPIYMYRYFRSNYLKKNSTSLFLYIRDRETAITQKIEFNETKIF